MNKKFLTRHHLDAFSEETFAKLLDKKGEMAFFPFKDVGVDILSINKNNQLRCYQLKARNINQANGEYWFKIKKDLDKVNEFPNFYWVFCALKEGEYIFDFFVVPKEEINNYFKMKTEKAEFLQIKPKDGRYIIIPKRAEFNINQYRYN